MFTLHGQHHHVFSYDICTCHSCFTDVLNGYGKQLDKCDFLRKHLVTKDGVKPNPSKIDCILNFPEHKTPKYYYRRFISNFETKTFPNFNTLLFHKLDLKDPTKENK